MKLTNSQKKLIEALSAGASEEGPLLEGIYYKIPSFSGEYQCYGRMALHNDLYALSSLIGTSYKDCYTPIHWLR